MLSAVTALITADTLSLESPTAVICTASPTVNLSDSFMPADAGTVRVDVVTVTFTFSAPAAAASGPTSPVLVLKYIFSGKKQILVLIATICVSSDKDSLGYIVPS